MSSDRLIAAFIFVTCCTICVFGQFPVQEISIQGPGTNRVNLVVISEGYTEADLTQFPAHVQAVIDGFFQQSPFSDYKSYFNVYAVEVPSAETGTDHPGTANDEPANAPVFSAQTYFNSRFDTSGLHRLLTAENAKAFQVLQETLPDWDVALVLVNHTMYGGSGGSIAAISRHVQAVELALHELSHSFASLFDEYGGAGNFPGTEGPNVTMVTDRNQVKWRAWIDPATPIPTPATPAYADVIGVFEGANYHDMGWYRPKQSCKMRVLNAPFCSVCQEQIVLSIYGLLSPIDSFDPVQDTVIMPTNASREFRVTAIAPMPSTLQVQWFLDGAMIAEGTSSVTVDGSGLAEGNHTLEAEVTDTTALVRVDPQQLLQTSQSWQIHVAPPPGGYDRWVPHVTSATGGFQTQIYLRSSETEAPANVTLVPFDSGGLPLTPQTLTLQPNALQIMDAATLFAGEAVSHFAIDTNAKITVNAGYRPKLLEGATAHVPESITPHQRFVIYPGEWQYVFDGMALLNTGADNAEVWVHQMTGDATPHDSHHYTANGTLPPLAKLLAVFSNDFEDVPGAYFVIESSQPSHALLLRGTLGGAQPAFLFQTVPEIEP